jgi:zinc D-Ala-D-Ala carboxypeptidase
MISTKNFNPAFDNKLICTCSHSKCDKRSVKQHVLDMVQLVRDDAMRPLTITSGGRCQYHDSEKYRSVPADHQRCIAVDIAVSNGLERAELVELGLKHGFNAIGVAKTFVHLGYREGSQNVIWVY